MARLFDAYIIADWTAAEGKKLGEQTLWVGVAKRDVRFRLYTETHNVATRAEGEALIADLLAEHRKRGDRVLVAVGDAVDLAGFLRVHLPAAELLGGDLLAQRHRGDLRARHRQCAPQAAGI